MARVDPAAWSEGHDGTHATYSERLYPPAAIWVLVIGLAAVVGIAYGAAYGTALGWVAAAILATLGAVLLLTTSTIVRVDDRVLRAGRARLPLTAIRGVQPLDAEQMRQHRREGDPRDYVVLRAWSSRRGVAISLADPRDPHPQWIVSSRRPERLAEALASATASPGQTPATRSREDG
jgi:hypothetical protein